MADVRDIYRFIDRIAPFHTQEDFDNAGFLVGRGDREFVKLPLSELLPHGFGPKALT